MLATPSQSPEDASTPASQLAASPQSQPASKITRGHSCVLCQQRKVKCDRQKPCNNCIKARVECVISAPTLPRRRRRKLTESDLVTRLKRYEQLLKTHGVKLEDEGTLTSTENSKSRDDEFDVHDVRRLTMTPPRPQGSEKGALFFHEQHSHYVENTLWENLRDEIDEPHESDENDINETGLYPDPESFLIGFGSVSKDLHSLHPPPVHIFRLWQSFVTNVNPLIKMFHAPTVQQQILEASSDLQKVPRPAEALMFAIYFLAVISLRNEDCETMFGESRNKLITKYSHAAQQALINANFLKSLNLATLQAFSLYLVGTRKCYDPHSMWVLSGVAVRIAQRLGLHREAANLKVSKFDAEMRRRTWWQIIFLDGHASKLAGAGYPSWLTQFDTEVPLNVSDSDLSPEMKELPLEKGGATEMMFCSMRYQVARTLRGHGIAQSHNTKWCTNPEIDLVEAKDKAINELEKEFEEKYVQHCDASIPLHLLVIFVAKSVICTMKIMAHHPRQYPDKGASMSQREKDFMFEETLKEVEIDTIGQTNKVLQRYLWHVNTYFQLDAFIYLVSELTNRTTGDIVDRAWEQVRLCFQFRQDMITDKRNSLYFALGNLTLKAWAKREDALGGAQVPPPRFISQLRAQRNIPDPPRQTTQLQNQTSFRGPNTTVEDMPHNQQSIDTLHNPLDEWTNPAMTDVNFDMAPTMPQVTPVDWEYWQTLMDGDLPAYNGGGDSMDMGETYFYS